LLQCRSNRFGPGFQHGSLTLSIAVCGEEGSRADSQLLAKLAKCPKMTGRSSGGENASYASGDASGVRLEEFVKSLKKSRQNAELDGWEKGNRTSSGTKRGWRAGKLAH
jgi:hypothetical protein